MTPSTSTPQPALYLPHGGGPWPWMDDPEGRWTGLRDGLATLPDDLPRTPRALVVITAHWEEPRFTVSTAAHPGMIYDYGGFPPETYSITYPAPGEPDVARSIVALAADRGIVVDADDGRGFDHGVFVPLTVAFPEATIPVVSVSLRVGLDPLVHVDFGRAIASLRHENVLIIGSGLSTHDLSFRVRRAEAEAFHSWLDVTMDLIGPDRDARLATWSTAPGGRACHPRPEHLLPLMVAAGAGGDDPAHRVCAVDLFGLPATGYAFDAR